MGKTARVRSALKAFTVRVARVVTRVLLVVGLFLIYFVAVAFTSLWVRLLPGGRSRGWRSGEGGGWAPAEGYRPDLAEARRQS